MNRAEKRRQQKLAKKSRRLPSTSGQPGVNAPEIQQSLDLAVQHYNAGRLPEAEGIFQKILHADPNQPVALNMLGVIAHQVGKGDIAIGFISKALATKPDYYEAHGNLGNALQKLGQLDEAVASYKNALAIKPDLTEAHYNLANVFRELGKLDEAVASYHNTLALKPDLAEAHNNLGNALQKLRRRDEAVSSYRESLAIKPDLVEAHNNLGNVLQELGLLDESEDFCRRAIELKPDYAEAHSNLSQILFGKGLLKEAWKESEWRWQLPKNKQTPLKYPQPRWDGTPITSKRILVWSEQGVGDEIRFAGMIPDLVDASANVVIEADPRLVPLFRRSFPDVSSIAKENPPSPEACSQPFDFQIPSGSLGQWFRNDLNSFPDRRSYLVADAPLRATIRERYQDGSEDLLVGISWSSKNQEHGDRKSLSLNELHPLAEIPGIKLVDLQYGDTAEERAAFEEEGGHVLIHDDEIDQILDMDAFASQVAALDLVVTISNTTAHVAGALGVPTWVLLDTAPLPCWMIDRNDSPWYSSVKLIRQSQPGDWKGVMEQAVHELGKFLNS